MFKINSLLVDLVLINVVFLRIASAQEVEEEIMLNQLVDQTTVEMPITTTPATFLLGSAGESVPRLSSFRSFSVQIARAFDEKGEVVNSVSAEIAPALVLENLDWEKIVNNQLWRTWARTTFSVAITPDGESVNERSAVGIQSILYAPAMDGALLKVTDAECRGVADSSQVLNRLGAPPVPPDEPTQKQREEFQKALREWEGSGAKELREKARENIEKCQDDIDAILSKWNQPMVSIGVGSVYNSDQDDSSAYWLTAAYGADFSGDGSASSRMGYLLTAHARNTSNVLVSVDDTNAFGDEDLLGLNLRVGNAKFSFLAEYSVVENDALSDDRRRSVLGMEYKLGDDLYLTLGVGRDSGATEAQKSVISGLKWGFGKMPVLTVGGA